MNEIATPPTTAELVAQGVKLFANAETALGEAQDALLALRKVYPQAYANANLAGGDAIKANATAVVLAGEIAAIRAKLIAFHEQNIVFAKAAGADLPGPYAELPPVTGIHTDSGGR